MYPDVQLETLPEETEILNKKLKPKNGSFGDAGSILLIKMKPDYNITAAVKDYRSTYKFTDVTLNCNGREYRAHRAVLSASSNFFKNIFLESHDDHPYLVLNDVKDWQFQSLLDFMYTGETSVKESQIVSFCEVGKMLQIKGLCLQEDIGGMKKSSTTTIKHNTENVNTGNINLKSKNILNAIEAVVKRNMCFTLAAKIYDVPKMTLYDRILGKKNRLNILNEVGLGERDYKNIMAFCSVVRDDGFHPLKTNKSAKEIMDYMVKLKKMKDPNFSITELKAFQWWWAFSKLYHVLPVPKL